MPMNDFTHLHIHTQYSILDGAAKIDPLLDRAAELGFKSMAITDHGVMYGAVEFYAAAKKRGIKPIIGCEVYTAPQSRFGRTYGVDSAYGHLILLAENKDGYKNLMTLVSYSFLEGFYYKPRVDKELLKKYSNGLIALSGCLKGEVSMHLANGNYGSALKSAQEYADIFGSSNFYLEIQDHGIPEEKTVIDGMIKLSEETGLKLVATNDAHYINREDSILQDVLTCIQTGKKIDDDDRLKFFGQEFYVKSAEEMASLFSYVPSAVENTAAIAKRCNVELDFNKIHLPKIEIETELTHFEYLKKLCCEGAAKKYGTVTEEIKKRIEYELKVIESMGYTDYFLIVWDFIKFAKDSKIPVGPGRGSAAGSIVSYCLNITEVDPIKYDLVFERFLNPERISMPDIDIDICNERRDEVKEYVSKKYGESRVASIITFGTLAARAAVRDVGRVMNISPQTVDKAAKSVPNVLHIKLKDAIEKNADLKHMYETDTSVKKMLDIAIKLEGFVRHVSTHAAGVVIADDELFNYVPVQTGDTVLLTQYPMESLEKIGLLKMDFLGLRNLTIIDNTVKLVKKQRDITIDLAYLDYNDEKTFKLIQKGDTDGVFQLENPGLQAFLRKFKPKRLEDIIATTSIYRPGPMEQIPAFLENVKNPDKIKYLHPLLEPILKPTYGTVIYQEQVMSIVRALAGYSMGRADLVRRAMAKKKNEQMEKERKVFIEGLCENGRVTVNGTRRNGIDDTVANKIFDLLTDFANYAFNKSHAACYARVAYQTAYLKANYPTEYLAALLVSLLGNSHKIYKYVTGFKKYGVNLLPPDINKSMANFSVEGNDVRFGFAALKNVGMVFPQKIVDERTQNGAFKSFEDFINRMAAYDLNRRSIEVLIKTGVFDSVFPNRRVLVLNYESMLSAVQKDGVGKSSDQISFFSGDEQSNQKILHVSDSEDFTSEEKLSFENEFAGMYLYGNPMEKYLLVSAAFSDTLIYSLHDEKIDDGQKVNICGVVSNISKKRTKSGAFICTMSFTDIYDTVELAAFEKTYLAFQGVLKEGRVICVTAQVRKRNDTVSLSLISAMNADDYKIRQNAKLYLRLGDNSLLDEIKGILAKYRGDTQVCIYMEDTGAVFTSDKNHCVRLCAGLAEELNETLGCENVRIK